MNLRMVALLAALMVPIAAAQEPVISSYDDRPGDAPPQLDILALRWEVATIEPARPPLALEMELAADSDPGSGYTAILFFGHEGDDEPTAWYIAHSGPGGDHLVYGHDAAANPIVQVERTGTIIRWDWADSFPQACSFAVGRTVTYPPEGAQVEDVVGWSSPDIEDAWNRGAACSEGPPPDAHIEHDEPSNGVPAAGIGIAAAALWLARRTQP